MENKSFYDRKQELTLLEAKFANLKSGEILAIYGRIRVGQATLSI